MDGRTGIFRSRRRPQYLTSTGSKHFSENGDNIDVKDATYVSDQNHQYDLKP